MNDIIIAGYPKSGNTWVTRLVAELVACPVIGFWNYDHNEIAREGLDRKSSYRCYKSHHQLSELSEITTGKEKIIYVLRDPRDVVISGAYYFDINRWPKVAEYTARLFKDTEKYQRLVRPLFTSEDLRIRRMMQTVLYGSEDTHYWTRISWENHYKPYIEKHHFFVQYENLLENPFQECQRILDYLGLERSHEQIHKSIENQSFAKKKASFERNNQPARAHFMRKGKSEQWRKKLSVKQKSEFKKQLGNELIRFGYSLD